jgi:hypothetical protein
MPTYFTYPQQCKKIQLNVCVGVFNYFHSCEQTQKFKQISCCVLFDFVSVDTKSVSKILHLYMQVYY